MEQFNTIPTSGNWSDIAGILDANFLRCYTALVQSESLVGLSGSNFQGIYTSASALPDMSSSGWALVGSSLSALTLYVYNTGSSEWGELNSTTYNFTDFTEFQTQLDALSSQVATIGLKIGNLANLQTTERTNLTGAINEVKGNIDKVKDDIDYLFQNQDGDVLYIADARGNVVAKIDASGITAIDVKAGGKSLHDALISDSIVDDLYEDKFYIADASGNVVAYFDNQGLHAIAVNSPNLQINSWYNKNVATYGDSVTAINNGDFSKPFTPSGYNWGNEVAKYYTFAKHYGRGIGSTCFKYRAHGGQVAWVNTASGVYVNRNDSYNYDNYQGNVTIPDGCTPIRGDGCSWLRITMMFPASIKDTIDAVLIMFHNDYHQDLDTEAEWVDGDTTDPEWAASSYYSTLGGDYNIGCVKGGIASTIMKLQAWMPNALLILMTPISGVYATSGELDGNFDNTQAALMKKLADCVQDVASRMSIPCINNYGNDGINSLNRTTYIADNIHPYSTAGRKAVARSVISGMMSIIPKIQ